MIRLQRITQGFRTGEPVFDDITIDLPSDRRLAVLGHKETGKTTFIQLLSGQLTPARGKIERFARVSFPAGFLGGLRPTYTARRNIMFAAQLYGADPAEVFAFVAEVTGLGDALEVPIRQMSLQNRVSLSYTLAYALPFDCYLFDNTIAPVGSALPEFQSRCRQMFDARTAQAGAIIATRHARVAQQLCDCAVVIRDRGLVFFENVNEAAAVFENDVAAATPAASEPELLAAAEGDD